jgi:hypothetical protein
MESSLLELLNKKNKDGSYVYPPDDVKAFLAALLLSSELNIDSIPPVFKRVVGEVAAKLGLDPSANDPVKLKAALDKHFKAHPINPELSREFRALVAAQRKSK